MDRSLLYDFFNCGDDQIIQFAITRAHLNKHERDIIKYMIDECMTQEKAAEVMGYSPRRVQEFWYTASSKLLLIPWVEAYAKYLRNLSK